MILAMNGKDANKERTKKRKSNPALTRPSLKHRAKKNPAHFGGFGLMDVVKVGAGAAAGAVATRGVTQAILGSKNTGVTGYAANLGVAIGLGWLTGLIPKAGTLALGVMGGGLAATILRIWSDKVSQTTPAALSGLGDLDFSADGMGDFVETPFPTPTTSALENGNWVVQDPYRAALPPAPAATVAVSPATGKATASPAPGSNPAPAGHRLASRFPQAA